jgi:Ser/Thr protein kinase RdoA (MazF antagonist)
MLLCLPRLCISKLSERIDESCMMVDELQCVAEAALKYFDVPPYAKATLINLSENATFKIGADDGQCWALRIHRQGYHSRQAIASELSWLMELRNTGVVTTPCPLKGRDGKLIQSVAGRNVVLFEWETGSEPVMGQDLTKPFEVLGEVAAHMHVHAKAWPRPVGFTRFTWDFDTSLGKHNPHWGKWRDGMGVDAPLEKLFGQTVDLIGKRLGAYGKGEDRFGLIHGDLRLANLLIDGHAVKVIDFDDCGFGWYMYDAATPISFYEHEPQVPSLIESWKTGYRRVIDLPRADENEIPTFVMLRRLLLVAWIGSRSETQLAKSMGLSYTLGTATLCENYLSKNGNQF